MGEIVDPAGVARSTGEPARTPSLYSPGYPTPVQPLGGPGARRVGGPFSALRFLLRRAIWVLIRILRAIWKYPIGALLIVLALYLGMQGYERYIAEPPPPPPAIEFDMVAAIPPADGVVKYLLAQKEFDAQKMWESFSLDAQNEQLAQGSTLDALRRTMQQQQQRGFRYADNKYVGGVTLEDKTSTYFYVTTIRAGNNKVDIYQIFVVDAEGKVKRVDQQSVEQQAGS